jgi:choline dehydrogenase-like flavoprotein
MIISASNFKNKNWHESCDICVVGSGAGGAVMASELAQAGLSVLLLEEGGYHTAKDFTQREDEMVSLLYQDRGARATKDVAIPILQGRCVGGSTTVNNLCSMRLPDFVLRKWHESYGLERWSSEALTAAFEKVEKRLHVTRVGDHEHNANNQRLKEGCQRLGWHGEAFKRNALNCVRSGFCWLGCAYDAKQSMQLTYVMDASEREARVFSDCRVEKIRIENGEAVGVEAHALDPKTGEAISSGIIDAKIVVASAGAVGSPSLLFRSGLRSKALGEGMTLHPSLMVYALFEEPIYGYRGIPMSYYCDEFFTAKKPDFVIEGIFVQPAAWATGIPSFGPFHRKIMDRYPYYTCGIVQIHDEPSGRVTPTRDGRPKIAYGLSSNDQAKLREGAKRAAQIYFAAGAREVLIPTAEPLILRSAQEISRCNEIRVEPNRIFIYSAHPQGGCAFGSDPQKAVAQPSGETHEIENLFVSDASLFPTSIGVNPQLTIMAIATELSKDVFRKFA